MSECVAKNFDMPKVGISNLNCLPKDIALAGFDRMRQILDDIDPHRELLTHGYELTPTRAAMLSVRSLRGLSTDEIPYSSGHESWGHGFAGIARSLWQTARGLANREFNFDIVQIGGDILLSEQHASLNGLAKLAGVTGYDVPIVGFGNRSHRGVPAGFTKYGFPEVSAQVAPEVPGVLEAGDKPHLLGSMLTARGIDSIVWDNHHAVRPFMSNLNMDISSEHGNMIYPKIDDVVNSIAISGMRISAFHISAGRLDGTVGGDREHTMDDLKGLISGRIDGTRMADTIAAGYDICKRQDRSPDYLIVEVPSSSLTESNNPYDTFVSSNRDMAENITEYWSNLVRAA